MAGGTPFRGGFESTTAIPGEIVTSEILNIAVDCLLGSCISLCGWRVAHPSV